MAASTEEHVPNALQVMSPNATATQEVLRGNVEANHESVGGLVDGVAAAPLQDGLPISGIQVETVNPLSSDGVVATQEQVNVPMNEAIHAVVPGQGQTLSTPNVALEDGSVHSVSASVQQGSSSLTVVRWITRLNEYLAAQGQTVFGSVGFNTPTQGPRHAELTTQQAYTPINTPSRGQHATAAGPRSSAQNSPLVTSPPEDLPQHQGWPPRPDARRNEAPLFTRDPWEQMMGFSQRAPWLYGRGNSQGESTTGSSEVQAEVQRQLGAMMRTQSQQLEEMGEELYYLRAERMRLLEAGRGDERPRYQGDQRGLQYEGIERPHAEGPSRGLQSEGNEQPHLGGPLRGLQSEVNEQPQLGGPLRGLRSEANERPQQQGDLRGTQQVTGLSRFGNERRDPSLGLEGMAVEQEQQDRNVRPRVSLSGEEDPVLRGPAGPPVVYGPSISATQCETRGGDPRRGTQELSRPASTMTTTERLLEKVAEGLHQLQQAQLEKLDKRSTDEAPEQCKPGTTTLPSLSALSGNESAVALQDWLEVIDGPLRDISDSSSWWWDAVKKRACESYRVWVASGPYERLAHKPPTAEDLEKGNYSRLSARTAGMLLQAMAETVRAEMVARSITRSPVALLFRLYTMYQTGGESEKAYILQYLVTPPKAQTAVEMVATLRQWERMLLRADNLSIAKPDPSLLVRGLNALVGDVWAKDRDVTFRTQLVKSRLGVDVSPTWESALQLHQHLRAEAENMVHALPTTTTTKPAVADGQRDPKLRPLQPNQSQGNTNLAKASSTTPPTTSTISATVAGTGEKKCKWFTEPQGCRRGASCKFVHSFEGISKKNRCYTRGAEGHQSSSSD